MKHYFHQACELAECSGLVVKTIYSAEGSILDYAVIKPGEGIISRAQDGLTLLRKVQAAESRIQLRKRPA